MADLIVNNITFNYPDPGTEPGWGSDATAWAEEITNVVNSIVPPGALVETQGTIANGVSNQVVPGLAFSDTQVKAAEVVYRIYRKTDSSEHSEQGVFNVIYKPEEDDWYISRVIQAGNNCLVKFDIDDTGQVIYTSTSIAGTNYQGFIRFKTIVNILA